MITVKLVIHQLTSLQQERPPQFASLEHSQPIDQDEVFDWPILDGLSVTNPGFAHVLTASLSRVPETIRTDRILPFPSRLVRTRTDSNEPYRNQHFNYRPPSELSVGEVRSPHYLAHAELPFHATKRKAAELEEDIAEHKRKRILIVHEEEGREQPRIRDAMAVERLSSPEPSPCSGLHTFSPSTPPGHVTLEPETHAFETEQAILLHTAPATHGDVISSVEAPVVLAANESDASSSPSATVVGDAADA